MYDDFSNHENGLVHQGRNFDEPGRLSDDHWSRGNGWGYIALTELIKHLPQDHTRYQEVVKYFKDHSKAMLPYQSKRGLWRQETPEIMSYEESSGSGLILYGYGVGLRMGILDKDEYGEAFKKGIEGLLRVAINDDFSTNNSCPGCRFPKYEDEHATILAFVTTKMPYKDEHHSFAPLMFAMCEAYANGMKDLKVLKTPNI